MRRNAFSSPVPCLGRLRGQQDSARQAVYDRNADQLLVTAVADVIEYGMAKYSIPCPGLHRDQIEQHPVSEDARQVRDAFSCPTYQRPATRIVIVIPFDGEEDDFRLPAQPVRPQYACSRRKRKQQSPLNLADHPVMSDQQSC